MKRLWRALLQIHLSSCSMAAMGAPTPGLRVFFNRIKGVRFGPRAWVGALTYIDIHRQHPNRRGSVTIGEHVAIGHYVGIFTHDSLYYQVSDGAIPIVFGRVEIGDHCNISTGAFLFNCTIGSHSIVAPQAVVVNNEFPPYSLIAGNPATVVKDLRPRVEQAMNDASSSI